MKGASLANLAILLTLGSVMGNLPIAAGASVGLSSRLDQDPASGAKAPEDSTNAPERQDRSSGPATKDTTDRSSQSARTLLQQVLHRYGSYRDFQARFTETAVSRASGEGSPESGTVSFRRPDMWRWEYVEPERKVVVIRGAIATIAVEGESEVTRYDLGAPDERSSVGALLAGSETLVTLFSTRYEPSTTVDEPMLRLDPTKLSDEYDHVLLRVRRRDSMILEVLVVDPGGNSLRFTFSGFRGNADLAASLFEPPAGSTPSAPASRRPAEP